MKIHLNTLGVDFNKLSEMFSSYARMMGNYENVKLIYNDVIVDGVNLLPSPGEIIVRKKLGCIWHTLFTIKSTDGFVYDYGCDLCDGVVKILSHPPMETKRNARGAGRKSTISDSTLEAMIDWRKQGFNLEQIAKEFGYSTATVSNLFKKHKSKLTDRYGF